VYICFSQVAQNCRKLAAISGRSCSAIVPTAGLAPPFVGAVLGVDLLNGAAGRWDRWPPILLDMARDLSLEIAVRLKKWADQLNPVGVRLVWGWFCGWWDGPVRDPHSLVPDGGEKRISDDLCPPCSRCFLCGFSEAYAGGRGWIVPVPRKSINSR
jgi:hypothetical protein